jgi:hypothetical protein
MKKIMVILLVLVSLLLGGCSNGTTGASGNTNQASTSIPKMTLNQPLQVNTEHGNYTLTIEGVRTTEERNPTTGQTPESVVFLDYSYLNQNYTGANGEDLNIPAGAFQVMDDSGTILNTAGVLDKSRLVQDAPIGGKCAASIAYALLNDSKNITAIFRRADNQKLGEITIPITN